MNIEVNAHLSGLSKAVFFVFLCFAPLAHCQLTPCDATQQKPCIVQDTETSDAPVRNLRSASMIAHYYQGNLFGVDQLNVSVSAQPRENGWQVIADYIKGQKEFLPEQIYVLDLRQESHGYLNGNAITLCNKYNWINLGKNREEVTTLEKHWLNDLALSGMIANILSTDEFSRQDYNAGKNINVETVASEADLLKKTGFHYLRLAVTDHRAPLPADVDVFVEQVSNLPANSWLHIHCRGGKGRSMTFMAMYDMLKNADKVSFDDIIARQASIPPFYDLKQVVRDNSELTTYYFERLIFLGEFYEFAQQRLSGSLQSWSQWKEERIRKDNV